MCERLVGEQFCIIAKENLRKRTAASVAAYYQELRVDAHLKFTNSQRRNEGLNGRMPGRCAVRA